MPVLHAQGEPLAARLPKAGSCQPKPPPASCSQLPSILPPPPSLGRGGEGGLPVSCLQDQTRTLGPLQLSSLPVLPLLFRLPVSRSPPDSWMPFSRGRGFTAQILPAPLGLAQMSPPLGLITPLRVSRPPCAVLACSSYQPPCFTLGRRLACLPRRALSFLRARPGALLLILVPMERVGPGPGFPGSSKCS